MLARHISVITSAIKAKTLVSLFDLLRALLLIRIGFAGAFTAFPIFDAQMRSELLRNGLVEFVATLVAYCYSICAVVWMSRLRSGDTFRGLTKFGGLAIVIAAYAIGFGLVTAVTLL